MEHVAIMHKSWGFTEKIASGQKVIESRWYKRKYAPWKRIEPGERIYFKSASEPVTAQAEVEKIDYFEQLTPQTVRMILETYGEDMGIETEDIPLFYERFKERRYGILIHLKNGRGIEPFAIHKQGFGMMSSWLSVESVASLKLAKLRK
jgi:ASC-1-like (ASCH) protein